MHIAEHLLKLLHKDKFPLKCPIYHPMLENNGLELQL